MKVAILGAAHPHVEYALQEVPHRQDLQLVGAAESDPQMRETFLADLGDVPVFDSVQDLIAQLDFDVALVAGIYSERANAVLAALAAGAHVLAAKPLCTSLEDLERIEESARGSGKHVSVVFEKRFYPATLALREVIE